MRAFIAGNGSMGKRRERDLRTLGVDATAYDAWPQDRGLTPDQAEAWEAADAVVLSTPPLTKHRATYWASTDGKPCFTEADVESSRFPHLPSCTPRFVPAILRIKERIERQDIGTTVAYTLHVGQHLADWHPGADLSLYYAAKRETGACREMVPFELGWLTWVFGPVTKAKALRGSLAGIADIDDVYQVVVEHTRPEKGSAPVLGHLLIDAVSRPPIRRLNVVGTLGTFEQRITFTEAVYLAEMRAFVKSVEEGAPWPYSLAEERANLDVLHTIERSG